MHLPAQLAEVDPIVASFCGGAVGAISALLVVEVRRAQQAAAHAWLCSAEDGVQAAHSCPVAAGARRVAALLSQRVQSRASLHPGRLPCVRLRCHPAQVNNIKQQIHNRCHYCQGAGYLTCGHCVGCGVDPSSSESCAYCAGSGKVMCTGCLCTGKQMATEHDPRIDPFT